MLDLTRNYGTFEIMLKQPGTFKRIFTLQRGKYFVAVINF